MKKKKSIFASSPRLLKNAKRQDCLLTNFFFRGYIEKIDTKRQLIFHYFLYSLIQNNLRRSGGARLYEQLQDVDDDNYEKKCQL